jgi:hypothetical protein
MGETESMTILMSKVYYLSSRLDLMLNIGDAWNFVQGHIAESSNELDLLNVSLVYVS